MGGPLFWVSSHWKFPGFAGETLGVEWFWQWRGVAAGSIGFFSSPLALSPKERENRSTVADDAHGSGPRMVRRPNAGAAENKNARPPSLQTRGGGRMETNQSGY